MKSNIYSEIVEWLGQRDGVMIYIPKGIEANVIYKDGKIQQIIAQGGKNAIFTGLPDKIAVSCLTVAGIVTDGGLFVAIDIIHPNSFVIIECKDMSYNMQWQTEKYELLKALNFCIVEHISVVAGNDLINADGNCKKYNFMNAIKIKNAIMASLEYPIKTIKVVYNDQLYANGIKDNGKKIRVMI